MLRAEHQPPRFQSRTASKSLQLTLRFPPEGYE